MRAMGHEANQLIDAGREAFRPTEADRARLMAALAGTATLSVGAAMAAGAAQRSLSGIFTVAPAARLLAFALPLAAAGAYGWHTLAEPPPRVPIVRRVAHAPAALTPRVAPSAAPVVEERVEAPTEEVQSERSAPSLPERPPSPSVESSKRGVEIRQEVALLSKAQTALSRGRPQEALEALSEHAQRFPRGVLVEERAATRARTLCALGRRQEAESELKRMEKLNPTSAYLARAKESCGSR